MSDRRTKSEIIAELAKDYAERIRRGERPTAREYSARYPEFSDEVERFIASKRVDEAPASADEGSPRTTPEANCTKGNVQPERIGDFRIIRQVGRGGMGIVYEAEQISLGRHVALKLLPPQMLLDARQRRRFEREARSAAKLHHTNIVPVFGVGESDGLHYYAMQFIEGLGLDEVLKQVRRKHEQCAVSSGITLAPLHVSRRNLTVSEIARSSQASSREPCPGESSASDSESSRDEDATWVTPLGKSGGSESVSAGSTSAGRLSDSFSLSDSIVDLPTESSNGSVPGNRAQNYWHSVADVGLQVASALQYAHQQGVFHRDIKPSNLLLDTRGTIWVVDFGLAKASDQNDLTHTGDVVGTLRYMPPEAFEGRADARSDIYSLGLTLYEMLALRPAFNEAGRNKLIKHVTSGEPTRLDRLDRKIPRDLVTIVHKAIDRDPKRRYQTAEELADDLNRFTADKPIRARRALTIEHVYRWARRNRALSTSLGLIALLLITINIAGPILTVRLKQAYDAEVRVRRQAKYAYESEVVAHTRASQAEREAVAALGLAKQKEQESLQSLQLAEQREHALNRTLYRAEMSLAGQAAVERTGIERVWDMTAAWRPRPGDEDLRDWEWYYLHGLGRLDQRTIQVDSGNAEAVAWHPDGSQIALGRDDGTVEVWDLRLGRAVFSQNQHHAPVLHVCWNSDGSLLASIASQDDHVRIWEPATQREIQTLTLPGANDWSGSVSFNRNDRLLAADGLDEIAIWDLQTGQRLRTLKMPKGIGHVAWSPTDDRIAAASKQEQISIWNGITGEQLRSVPEGSRCLAWDPQGQRLAFAGQDRRIHVLDAETGEKSSSSVGHVAEITTLAWDASGMRLASAGRDTTVRIWDLPNCDEIARFRGHAGTVTSLDWNPLGTLLVTAAQDQTIKIWDADQTEEQISLQGPAGPVQSTSWGPQGSRLAVSSGAWTRLWNIDRRAEESVWQGQLAVINPIDERIAIATQSDIQIRDTRTGKLVKRLLGHTQGITAIRWDSEGKRLASASWDGTARIWDVARGKEQTTLRLSHHDRDICWSPDGTCLATIGNREVQIWHVESETIRLEYLDDHQIHAIAWSPDGQSIATSGWGHEITIWDASTAETVMVLTGHTSPVKSLCWSPASTRLASGSEDQLVRIWDVQSRGELLSLRGHTDGVTSVCWSSDGMRIASGDRQGRVLIWDASSGHVRERTPQSLEILNRRIDSEPGLRDLALRAEVLEKMGRGEAASEDRRRIRLIRESDFEQLASDPVALELLVSELSAEVRTREAARWTRIKSIEMTADNGATLSLQPDNSIYVTGPNTSGVQYELSFAASAPVTALRLEAIPDPRLPHGGSGRSAKNGNFHVAEINVFAAQSADAETFDEITIEKCSDDMPDSPASRRAVQTIDGNRRTRWDPYPNHQQHHWAVYEFAEPLAAEGEDVVIRVRLDSGISQWGPHGLGRFRLSATGTAYVLEREELLQLLDGTRSMGIARLGGFYAMLSETQKAGTAFATALRSAEDHAARQAIVALASRFDGVVEELFKLLPEDSWVMLARADSLIAGPDAASAARMRGKAIALLVDEAGNAPETILLALSDAADTYQARGQWDGSLQLLRQAYERSRDLLSQEHPRTIELLDKLAATHNRMGNQERARILREEEVALRQRLQGMEDAQTRASCRSLADLYARSRQISEAISLRVRMAEAAPLEDINGSQQAAFFLVWKGDLNKHVDLCRKLLESAGAATETVKAARDFAKAVAIGPVTDSDLVEQSVTLAAHAVEAAPSNSWGVLSLGMCHYRQGNLMQADRWLTPAAEAEPPRLRLLARAFLAMLRFQQGELEEATHHLHAVEQGLGLIAFTDLRSPFAIHHDDLAIWLALQEVRRMMQVEPVDLQQAVDRLLEWQRSVVENSPDDTRLSLHLAAMYAWFGRDRQHRELCQRLLAAASVSKQTTALERAAKAYLVHSAPEPDLLASAAVSGEMAVDGWKKKPSLLSWAQLTAGMAAYRQQRYTEAIESLTSAQQASNRLVQGPSLLFRCMTYLRQGQRERAEQDFARADELIGLRPDRTSLTEALSQHDELVFWLAYDEARQQLAETTDEQSSTAE